MRKIVLEVNESLYDRLVCLALSKEKGFGELVVEMFQNDEKAQRLYDEMYQKEFEKLVNEEKLV